MTLNLTTVQTPHTDFSPRITVIGVGGGGTNAVDNMLAANLQGRFDCRVQSFRRVDQRGWHGIHPSTGACDYTPIPSPLAAVSAFIQLTVAGVTATEGRIPAFNVE